MVFAIYFNFAQHPFPMVVVTTDSTYKLMYKIADYSEIIKNKITQLLIFTKFYAAVTNIQ